MAHPDPDNLTLWAMIAELPYWEAWAADHGYQMFVTEPAAPLMKFVRLQKMPAAPAAPAPPRGKGMFIWQVPATAGGNVATIAERAAAAWLAWVAVKIHDGTSSRNGDVRPLAEALLARSVRPWAWGYNYGADPVGEARVAVARYRTAPFDGYLIDAEHEYKGRQAQAAAWVAAWRADEPRASVGLCSYRYPDLHADFPWSEFLAGCDFHAPQLYWLLASTDTAPAYQLAKSRAQLLARRELPYVPIGVAAPHPRAGMPDWWPSVGQLANFSQAAIAAGLPGIGYWVWQFAETRPDLWAEIARQPWPVG